MNRELFIVRNKSELDGFISYLKNIRLPAKLYFEEKRTKRTLCQNSYLWGVVYKRISDYTGHNVDEVHEGYMSLYGYDFRPNKKGEWSFRRISSTEFSSIDLEEWALIVRAHAFLEFGIIIELPNETFNEELDFSNESGYPFTDCKIR